MTHEEVINILNDQSGRRYDGNIVRTLSRWFESSGNILFSMGDPIGQAVVREPISDSQRAEVVVLSQILHILYQFQSLYDGYFILDHNQNYCVWSDGMQELTGKSIEQVVGTSWQRSDVKLAPIAQTGKREAATDDEIVVQVARNGRSQFSSRVCEVDGFQQVSVDVYTLPIMGGPDKVNGVVQLFRRKGGVRRQSREYVELKLAATRDPLTGVANRGQLETQLRHVLDDFHNHEGARGLGVIFLDVDKFKNINDTHGHKAGDQVLVDLTRLLQHETYSGELIARYGGEEFIVVCPDADLTATIRRAERLRDAVAKSSVGGISNLSVTASFGVAAAHLGDSVQTLLERADAALYRAKETGRNRTCWEGQVEDEEVSAEVEVKESESRVTESKGTWSFAHTIPVNTSLELTAMKLNAFIDSTEDAEISHQEHGHLKLTVGTLGFMKRWGPTTDKQAVKVDIRFETSRGLLELQGKQSSTWCRCRDYFAWKSDRSSSVRATMPTDYDGVAIIPSGKVTI